MSVIPKIKEAIEDAIQSRSEDSLDSRFMLESLTEDLARNFVLSLNGEKLCNLPVILVVDEQAGVPFDSDGSVRSGIYSEANATSVRNHYEGPFLLIIPEGIEVGPSLTKSITNLDDISQRVLQNILAELLEDEDDLHEPLVKQCNLYAKEIGLGTQTFCLRFWGLIERIIKVCAPLGVDKKLAGILFVLGLPNCTSSEILGRPKEILSRRVLSSTKRPSIANHIYAKGINQSFQDWIDDLVEEEDLSKALESCRDHFFAGGNDSANFNDDPQHYYGPHPNEHIVPNWFIVLTAKVWEKILGSESVTPQKGRIILLDTSDAKKILTTSVYRCNQTPAAKSINADGSPLLATDWELIELKDNTLLSLGSGDKVTVNSPPAHSKRLIFQAKYEDQVLKSPPFICMSTYHSPLVYLSKGANSISLPQEVVDFDPEDEEKYDFELDVNFPKTGGYSSELLLAPEWMPGEIVAINASEGSGVERKDLRLVDHDSNSYRFQLVTDEECAYEVRDCQKNDGTSCTVRINVTAESGLPEQKSNVLEVLRAQQIKPGVYQVDASSSDNDLALIQSCKLSSSGESYQPLVGILGGDKVWSSWRAPNDDSWKGAILGGSNLHQDIRPTNFCPPDKLISAWKELRAILVDASEEAGIIEAVRFYDLASEDAFTSVLLTYCESYLEWLNESPKDACWWETITVRDDISDPHPVALLLSPLHPLRIGWLSEIQVMLQKAAESQVSQRANSGMPPLVGIDSSHCPSFWKLYSKDTSYDFISIKTGSDYWGLLLSDKYHLGRIEYKKKLHTKLEKLGLNLPPIGAPLDDSHIREILLEVTDYTQTRRTLKVGLSTEGSTNKKSSRALLKWFYDKAKPSDSDSKSDWSNILPLSVEVYTKSEEDAPASSDLATLSSYAPASLKWYGAWNSVEEGLVQLDLLLRAEMLPGGVPSWKDEFPKSPTSSDFLLSRRLQKMEVRGAEKLISTSFQPNEDSLLGSISNAFQDQQVKNLALRNVYDQSSLGITDFKVDGFYGLPSAGADPSLVTKVIPGGGVVWKLCLPPYSSDQDNANGFFLMASISNQMISCMGAALKSLDRNANESSKDDVAKVLFQLGQRGFDAVKHIADHEYMAKSNLGLLATSKLLTGAGSSFEGFLPIGDSPEAGGLLVPLDPFRSRLDQLRNTVLKQKTGARPDQLSIGFRFHENKLLLKLTPVESKCYEGHLSSAQRQSIIRDQLDRFIRLLEVFFLPDEDRDFKGWDLSRRLLLVEWIEYGLNCLPADSRTKTNSYYDSIISAVINGNYSVEVDNIGRLSLIDGSSMSAFSRHHEQRNRVSFRETLQLTKKDAYNLLLNDKLPEFLKAFDLKNADPWELLPNVNSSESDRNQETEELPPSLSDSNQEPDENSVNKIAEVDNSLRGFPEDRLADESPSSVDLDSIDFEEVSNDFLAPAYPKIHLGDSDTSEMVYWQPFGAKKEDGSHERLLGNSHAYIAGGSGYGKSHLLEKIIGNSLINDGVVPLYFDFVGDFASLEPDGYKVVNAADGFEMNPLQLIPKDGNFGRPRVQVYQLASLFKNACGLGDQQENKAKQAINSVYGDFGISLEQKLTTEPSAWPNFNDLWQYVQNDPDDRFKARMEPIFEWNIFKGSSGSFGELLKKPTIINFKELSEAGKSLDKLVSQILFKGIFSHLISGNTSDGLKYLIIIDEAHRVCGLPTIEDMLREVRKFGCGVWMASQSPDDFSSLKNLFTSKFFLRMETDDDARIAEKELTASSGSLRQDLRDLQIGECYYRDAKHSPFVRLKIRGE